MDAQTRLVQGLSKVVDDHISWLSSWHQVAFYGGADRNIRAGELKPPTSFTLWVERAVDAMPGQKNILRRIADLYSELHTISKLVILSVPDGEALPIKEYEKVLSCFDEFITAVRRLERAFSEAAAGLDPLTGLRTRQGLEEDFNREMNRLKNAQTPFVLAMLDLDHFKQINDNHGHETGDRVLVAVANTLLRHIRTYDDAFRMGGEEFLIILKGVDAIGAASVLERLRAAISRIEMKTPNAHLIPITASFGYAQALDGKSFDAVLGAADAALYKAKRDGRNRIMAG